MSLNLNFQAAVARMYPGVSFRTDVIIQDDGAGPYLKTWNASGSALLAGTSPPTDAQIATVMATPVVPQSVTMLQARLAIQAAGLTTQVTNAINADTTGVLPLWWEYATTVERQNPKVLQIAQTLGLTSAQLDNLFTQAAAM
jgi:hypothetical protein